MRPFAKLTGGWVQGSGSLSSPEASASARPPVFSSARALDAAIDAATFSRREPTEDGERILVFCGALGGTFIHSAKEVETRINRHFPGLAQEEATAAARFLSDRLATYMRPIKAENHNKSSYVHRWRYDY